MNGHASVCRTLLAAGASSTTSDLDGYSAIIYSITNGWTDVVETFLESGVSFEPTPPPPTNSAPASALPNATSTEDLNALSLACQYGHEGIARLLLERGAQILPNPAGYWPQHLAAREGHAGVLTLLVEATRGFSGIDVPDKYSQATPLSHAASEGHAASVRVLLKAGSDVHAQDEFRRTPIHYAAWQGHIEIVNLLLSAGATLEQQDNGKQRSVDEDKGEATASVSTMAVDPLEAELESDMIPSLSLPPPIIPFRICESSPTSLSKPLPYRADEKRILSRRSQLPRQEILGARHARPPEHDSTSFPFSRSSLRSTTPRPSFVPQTRHDAETRFLRLFDPPLGDPASRRRPRSLLVPARLTRRLFTRIRSLPDVRFQDDRQGSRPPVNVRRPQSAWLIRRADRRPSFESDRRRPLRNQRRETVWTGPTSDRRSVRNVLEVDCDSGDDRRRKRRPEPSDLFGRHGVFSLRRARSSRRSGDERWSPRRLAALAAARRRPRRPRWRCHTRSVRSAQQEDSANARTIEDQVPRRSVSMASSDRRRARTSRRAVQGELILLLTPYCAAPLIEFGSQVLPLSFGVNLELRYPTRSDARRLHLGRNLEVNDFVDSVLSTVYRSIQSSSSPANTPSTERQPEHRRIVLSSFNPVVCTALNWKQPNFSVFFASYCGLSRSSSEEYGKMVPANRFEEDRRCTSIREAVKFAKANNLLGVMLDATMLVGCSRVNLCSLPIAR